MRILIAINENKGINSKLSEHFGHCPYFAIYETSSSKIKIIENKLNHLNPFSSPIDQIKKLNPDTIFSLGMGKKAIELCEKKGIKVKTGNYKTVKEVLENLEKLQDLKLDCGH